MFTRLRAVALGTLAGALLVAVPAAGRVDDEPLARFEDRICPGVAGLEVEAAETMVGMIRSNVKELGLRTADERACRPNLIVAFVPDGQAYLRQAMAVDKTFLVDWTPQEREELLAQTGPARAIIRVASRSRDGMPVPQRQDLTHPPQSQGWMAHSRIYTATQNDIHSAMVLIDAEAVPGVSLRQLADYATFRALTRTLPPPGARGESIMGLFEVSSERPARLTEFDRRFLATLYAGIPNLPGSARLAALSKATGYAFMAEK